jgi:hypothetical protein
MAEFDKLLQFFRVLGNESRLKILGFLANEERNVGELAELLGVKEPTVSHHLSIMKELGLVTVRAEGNVRIYGLDPLSLEGMSRDLFSKNGLATLVTHEAMEEWEQKVISTFMDGERIKEMPSRQKKKLVILRWLLEKFESGREYAESEVNEIIKKHHYDYPSLRRYLIDFKLMARDKGIYWRLE